MIGLARQAKPISGLEDGQQSVIEPVRRNDWLDYQGLTFLSAGPLCIAMWSDLSLLISYCGSSVLAVSLVIDIFRMNFNDFAADSPGLRVPGHVITDFELSWHDGSPPSTVPS